MPEVRHDPDKFKRRAAAAQGDYAAGVKKPRIPWHQAVAAAEDAYTQGVQQSIADRRYAKAATPENGAKQIAKASTLGAQRYAPGIQASGDAYDKGFRPYVDVIRNTQLPARGPKGDPQNYERSRAMGTALNDAKKARKGS